MNPFMLYYETIFDTQILCFFNKNNNLHIKIPMTCTKITYKCKLIKS